MKKRLTSIALLLIGIPAHAEQITGILTLGLGVGCLPYTQLGSSTKTQNIFLIKIKN